MNPKPMIRKAVFPVAGMGTRFLPATKASPKEMMPIIDKPLIQYAVEEALSVGIQEFIFVTSSSKRAIEDHFDKNFELEYRLEQSHKTELLAIVRNILPEAVRCIYIRQAEPLGLGHAIQCAEAVVGAEPFAVLLADDLIDGSGSSCLAQMVAQFQILQSSLIAVESVRSKDVPKYGIVGVQDPEQQCAAIHRIIEKPSLEQAPSRLGVVGRYILTPKIFACLRETVRLQVQGSEIQLTPAIDRLIAEESVYAFQFEGARYDCGSKLGYLEATIHYGLKHAEVGADFQDFLKHLDLKA